MSDLNAENLGDGISGRPVDDTNVRTDAGTPDAGTPDAGTPDAGTPDADSITASLPTLLRIRRVGAWTPAGQWSLIAVVLFLAVAAGGVAFWFNGRTASASTAPTGVNMKNVMPANADAPAAPKVRHGQPTPVPSRTYGDPAKAKNNKDAVTFSLELQGTPQDLDMILGRMGVAVVGAEDAYMKTVQWADGDVNVHVTADAKQQHAIWGAMLQARGDAKHRVEVIVLSGEYAQAFLDWLWERI